MQTFFEKPKAKIIAIAAAVFLLLTAIIITIACLNVGKKDKDFDDVDDDDSIGAFAEKTDKPSSTTGKGSGTSSDLENKGNGLIFESNGDGTCSFVALKNYSEEELEIPEKSPDGDTVTAIADGALDDCDFLENVTIPASVKKIGTGVFTGCSSLVSISVDTSNTKYCTVSGVLFSKDKTILICYPAMKVGRYYLLSTNVQTIAAYAFDGIQNLEKILYSGSTSKFYDIDVKTGNGDFEALSVTCNYVSSK